MLKIQLIKTILFYIIKISYINFLNKSSIECIIIESKFSYVIIVGQTSDSIKYLSPKFLLSLGILGQFTDIIINKKALASGKSFFNFISLAIKSFYHLIRFHPKLVLHSIIAMTLSLSQMEIAGLI